MIDSHYTLTFEVYCGIHSFHLSVSYVCTIGCLSFHTAQGQSFCIKVVFYLYYEGPLMCFIHLTLGQIPYGPQREKTCLQGFANNKGTDQPELPREVQADQRLCFRFL